MSDALLFQTIADTDAQTAMAVVATPPAPPPRSARVVFGQNLRRARRLKDISQEDFALRATLSRTYISEVERGLRNVSIDNMELLARGIGMSLVDLLSPGFFDVVSEGLPE